MAATSPRPFSLTSMLVLSDVVNNCEEMGRVHAKFVGEDICPDITLELMPIIIMLVLVQEPRIHSERW
jgi:hypothetical protein